MHHRDYLNLIFPYDEEQYILLWDSAAVIEFIQKWIFTMILDFRQVPSKSKSRQEIVNRASNPSHPPFSLLTTSRMLLYNAPRSAERYRSGHNEAVLKRDRFRHSRPRECFDYLPKAPFFCSFRDFGLQRTGRVSIRFLSNFQQRSQQIEYGEVSKRS